MMSPLAHWSGFPPLLQIALAAGLILTALVLALRPVFRGQPDNTRAHDWGWGWLIFATLVAGRWPSILFDREVNADESFFFAGAHTAWLDPVFWRSIDGTTSGPLNFITLWPAGLLFGWDTFLAPRITALVVLAAALVLCHQCLALLLGKTTARLAGLSVLTLEAFSHSFEFLHFSSELVPMAFLAGGAYCCIRRWTGGEATSWGFPGGLLLGAVPLAKLQAAPLALCLGLIWVGAEAIVHRRAAIRTLIHLGLGAVLPFALFVFQAAVAGEWERFVISFVRMNLEYTGNKPVLPDPLWKMWLQVAVGNDSLYHLWLGTTVVSLATLLNRGVAMVATTRITCWSGLGAAGLSLLVIYAPARPTLHYWQFLVLPVTVLQASLLAGLLPVGAGSPKAGTRWRLVAAVALPIIFLCGFRVLHPNPLLTSAAAQGHQQPSALASLIRPHIRPGDNITIWGWSNYVNVEAGLPLASRDGNIYQMITGSPYIRYYRDNFLLDFIERQPVFFLDSVGPHSVLFHETRWRHDRNFPELAAVVQLRYQQIAERDGSRLYLRKDLLGR